MEEFEGSLTISNDLKKCKTDSIQMFVTKTNIIITS